mmetsp:Transcript_92273/g.162775  ORF Transcript_92273/g.162775 Transcript_92273/m.162775 type:complete len:258 (-) Transcript_92273:185-958(-)
MQHSENGVQQHSNIPVATCDHASMTVFAFTSWNEVECCISEHETQQLNLVFEEPVTSFAKLLNIPKEGDFVEAVFASLAYKAWGHQVMKVIPTETADGLSVHVTLDGHFDDEVAKMGDEDNDLKKHYGKTLLEALPQAPSMRFPSEQALQDLAKVHSVGRGSIVVAFSCTFAVFLLAATVFALWHNHNGFDCCPCGVQSDNEAWPCCCCRGKEGTSAGGGGLMAQSAMRRRISGIEYRADGGMKITLEPESPSCSIQ